MSLFKSPSPPPVVMPPPLPKPDTSAIEARVAEQEARLEQQTKELERTVEQQEERAKAEREREQRRLSASLAARRRGRRLLVSQDRTRPETGIMDAGDSGSLGPSKRVSRKPRRGGTLTFA